MGWVEQVVVAGAVHLLGGLRPAGSWRLSSSNHQAPGLSPQLDFFGQIGLVQ